MVREPRSTCVSPPRRTRAAAALTIGSAPALPRLDAGATARVDIPVSVAADASDGRASLLISVAEANGFGMEMPRRLTIPVRAARPPRLALDGVRTDDQSHDGRISAREFVEVTARVWNAGPGVARDVKASLGTGDDTFLVEESARQWTLGTLAPGEHRDLSFVFYTNTRARDVRIVLGLTETTGRFGATLTLPFAVDRPVTQTLDVAVAAPSPDDVAPPAPAGLLDEVERDIPRAAAPNPDAIAVVIGVERYASLPSARFAAGDAQLFGRYAAAALGVSDDRNHLYVRTDADATGNEFRKLFGDDGWLARRVRPTTDLYVYFSGHGAPDVKTRTPYPAPDRRGRVVSARDRLCAHATVPATRAARRSHGDRVSRCVLHRRDAEQRNAVRRRPADRDLRRAPCAAPRQLRRHRGVWRRPDRVGLSGEATRIVHVLHAARPAWRRGCRLRIAS